MTLRSQAGKVRRRIVSSLFRRDVAFAAGPAISFTFDDFPRTAAQIGAAVLENFGARGTYYVAPALLGTANECGEQFHAEDISRVLEHGHELASHTYGHLSGRSTPYVEFAADVEKGRKAVAEIAGADSGNFAYPFGHATLRTKRALGPGLTSSRGIVPGWNGPAVDLNLLRANSLYGADRLSAGTERLIAENAERKSWLIFYTHDVQPLPSPYGCSPALLESAVAAALKSGARVLSVREVLAELQVQALVPGSMETVPN
jgi:peptidoglycan/xylan/chitin deacetylase (PgdA/CDA1 family)